MLKKEERIKNFSKIYKSMFCVFYDISKLDNLYEKYLKKIINCKTDKDYYLLVCEFVNSFNDCHTKFVLPAKVLQKEGFLPFNFICIENNYYILNATHNLKQLKFCRIKKINGKSFSSYLTRCFKYVHHEGIFTYFGKIETFLPFFLKKKNNILTTYDNKTYHFDLLKEKPLLLFDSLKQPETQFNKTLENNENIKIFKDNILYVKINSFNNIKSINDIIKVLKKYSSNKKIILDLRNNEGGMTANAEKLANLFIDKEYSACKKSTRKTIAINLASSSQYSQPDEVLQNWIENGITSPDIIKQNLEVLKGRCFDEYYDSFGKTKRKTLNYKNLVLLTSKYTISAAEDFIAMFKTNKIGLIVGENTYGSTGTPFVEKFKDGSKIFVCSVYYKLKDETEFINIGIKPDIYMNNSIEDYKNNNDEVLNKTIKLLSNN